MGVVGVKLIIAVLVLLFCREYINLARRRWASADYIFEPESSPKSSGDVTDEKLRLTILRIVPSPPSSLNDVELRHALEGHLGVPMPRQRLLAQLNEMVRNDRTIVRIPSANGNRNGRQVVRRYHKALSATPD